MAKQSSNNGITKLIRAIHRQSQRVVDRNKKSNMLGTMTATGVYFEALDDEIPLDEFAKVKTETPIKPGDRVICAPVGDYYTIVGKVE